MFKKIDEQKNKMKRFSTYVIHKEAPIDLLGYQEYMIFIHKIL